MTGILLTICDQCTVRRSLSEGHDEQHDTGDVTSSATDIGVQVGRFSQLHVALAPNAPISQSRSEDQP